MTPIQSQTYAQHIIAPLLSQTSRIESPITDENRRTEFLRLREIVPILSQTSNLEHLINDDDRRAEFLRLREIIQQYSDRIPREPIQLNLGPDSDALRRIYEPIRQINLDDLLRRPPLEEFLIQKKCCCCNESTALKIALIVIGILFIGAAITCHFTGVHPAAVYSLASVGSLLIVSTAMVSLIQYLKKSSPLSLT